MELQGKAAIITGGSRGIGRGIALALARAGADCAIADVNLEDATKVAEDIRALGRKGLAIPVDVTQWDAVQEMVQTAIGDLGRIDILVNNAGICTSAPVEQLEIKAWDRMMEVNTKGVFLCSKAIIPHMKERGNGKIISLSSVAGKVGVPGLAHYCASKFAVVGFTNSLAKELARDNITVNAICPGIVKTAMWDYMADVTKLPGETIEESFKRSVDQRIPQGRPQTPEDIGALAVFLATADNITGQAINVDGGIEMH